MTILFFGSSSDSVLVLAKLPGVVGVVTQPPKPVGRTKRLTPTPVETWAKDHHIPVLYRPPKQRVDILVVASYGEKIPMENIKQARYGGLNVHPSLLPRWRGADPVPWAILTGDKTIGVTILTVTENFDQGNIITQQEVPITLSDTAPHLRARLFRIGAELLLSILPKLPIRGTPQIGSGQPVAKRFTRQDGFEPWEKILDPNESERINRKYRALHPWPGLWTTYKGKRLKILAFDTKPRLVQFEGKKPMLSSYLTDTR